MISTKGVLQWADEVQVDGDLMPRRKSMIVWHWIFGNFTGRIC
jgi:hypothetical protein